MPRLHRSAPRFPLHKTTQLNLEPLEDRFLPAVGLVLALGFDEAAGTSAADASGLGNNGILNGPTWTAAGRLGGALSFDGANDWVTVADHNSLDLTTGMTMEAWVKPVTLDGYRSVLVKEANNAVGLSYQLYANNGYPEPASYLYTSTDRMVAGTTGALPLNAWSHLASTFDGATLRIFVNGVQVGSQAVADPITPTTNPFRIGGDAPFGEFFAGLIDEVRVYNRALTAAEIQTDINTPISGGPVLPIVTIAASDANASETNSDPGVFTVSRTGSTTAALTINYSIGGTAANGGDYANVSGTVTLAAGSASASVTITPVDDALVEGSETVVLTVAANANYNVGTPGNATVTIADNDAGPVVTAVSPAGGAAAVNTAANITAAFDSAMNAATITTSTFQLRDAGNNLVAASVTYNSATNTATLDPTAALADNTTYTARVVGGASGVKSTGGNAMLQDYAWSFTTAAAGAFQESVAFDGLTQPTVVRFAPDGRVFVAEKSGLIKVYDSLSDPTPSIFADLSNQVHNFWDRGLLGMALDPNFPTSPYIYVLYSADADINGTFPKYGTPGVLSDPGPSATGSGALISGRLSRLQASGNFMTGSEQVLVWDWQQQFPSHSVGALNFGADGALYASSGDGASFGYVDYGQTNNPFNDPVNQGGALRSQDLRSSGDPVTLDGSIIRINPATGAGMPDNPLAGNSDPNARRIVAYGMRNPFRFTIRPGTNEIWSGDVGWNNWEEINRIVNPTDGIVDNFGWPAYEGVGRQSGYDAADLPLLEQLYNEAGAVVSPYYAYSHSAAVVPGQGEPTGSSSISGLAFYPGGNYPAQYQDALFFSDYSRNRIWVMFKGANGLPDPSNVATFVAGADGPVYLATGPNGDLYYCGFNDGTIRRIQFFTSNQPPTAFLQANPTSGDSPLLVNFDGANSTDPDAGATLTYAWDLDGDGQFDDSNAASPVFLYTVPGSYTVSLRVTDNGGLSDVDSVVINVDNNAPIPEIDSPQESLTWVVGQTINFSGHATDVEQGTLPASSLVWTLIMHHGTEPHDHTHTIQTFTGVASGSFVAPDHEYPSHLELVLTATDASGLQGFATATLDPETVDITAQANVATLTIGLGDESAVGGVTGTAIMGSSNSISAPTPQTINNVIYQFASWSDGGAATHNIVAGSTTLYTATYTEKPPAISISDASVIEGNFGTTALIFTVTLNSARTVPVSVNYATANGTAAAGSDYTAINGATVTFNPGEMTKTLTVSVLTEAVQESNETLIVNLSNPVNATLGDAQGAGTIIDDDATLIGSDSYGYKASVFTYENVNLAPGGAGVFTIRASGNNASTSVNLAASASSFNYYGSGYSTIFVSSNGLITMGSSNSSASNSNLTTSPAQAAIAPMWDDWIHINGQPMILGRYDDTNSDGVRDRLIIEWNNVQGATTSPQSVTFQAILQLNTGSTPGNITFNYPDLNAGNFRSNGGSATIGIKASGSQGARRILVALNNASSPYVGSNKAIRIVYTPPAAALPVNARAAMLSKSPKPAAAKAPAAAQPTSIVARNQVFIMALEAEMQAAKLKKTPVGK